MQDVLDATPAPFAAPQPKAESNFEVLKIAVREYCIFKYTSFNELGALQKLKTGPALHTDVNLVPDRLRYATPSAQGHASFACNVFHKNFPRAL